MSRNYLDVKIYPGINKSIQCKEKDMQDISILMLYIFVKKDMQDQWKIRLQTD